MKIAIGIIVAIIVLAGAYFLFAQHTQAPVTSTEATTTEQAPITATNNTSTVAHKSSAGTATTKTGTTGAQSGSTITGPSRPVITINYTNAGFSPKLATIPRDTTVNFVNNSDSLMWIASDPHPTHQGYSGTTVSQHCPDTANNSFDECTAVGRGNSYTFTFLKVGTWGYHNHENHESTGTIVVTQ
jgi:hypothetical protein